MAKVPDYIKENIYRTVKEDMQPSRVIVHSKVGVSVALGGGLSLFFCGQMGLGLSSLAERVHGWLMDFGGSLGCTVLCGVLFAAVPVLLLKLLSSRIQFLVLLRQERVAIGGWVMAFGAFLVFRNQPSEVFFTMALWGLPAVLSFYVLGWLIHCFTNALPWQQNQGFS